MLTAAHPGCHPDTPHPLHRRRSRILVAVLVLSVGPYVAFGFRTEQLGVYTGLFLVLAGGMPGVRDRRFWTVLWLWLGIVVLALAGLAGPFRDDVRSGPALASLDNLTLPLMTWLLASHVVGRTHDERSHQLRLLCRTWLAVAAVGSVIALISVFVDLTPVLGRFWSSAGGSVAELSYAQGRTTGIFNQPAEAGAAYSLALFAAWWLQTADRTVPRLHLSIATALVLVAGFFTVSKLFLAVGVPLYMWMTLRARLIARGGMTPRFLLIGLLAFAGGYLVFARAGVLSQLEQSLDLFDRGVLDGLSGGRFGSGSTLKGTQDTILATSPVFGFGIGGIVGEYDSAHVEVLAHAGLAGLLLYAIVLVRLARGLRSVTAPAVRRLGVAVLALGVLGGLGLPVLTANRVGVVWWLLMAACYLPTANLPTMLSDTGDGAATNAGPSRSFRTDERFPPVGSAVRSGGRPRSRSVEAPGRSAAVRPLP